MKKCSAIIGTYNHFPEGLPGKEREKVYQTCYKPFLSVLYRYPDIQAVLCYSGPLLSWLSDRHPEFIMLLADLVSRKQVEIIGGGYHFPLLPLIPQPDRLGQCEALNDLIRKNLGKRPRGAWISNFAWEQSLAGSIQASGFNYIFLSEAQFRMTGIDTSDRLYPVLTEDQGKSLVVFPVADAATSSRNAFDISSILALDADAANDSLPAFVYRGESFDSSDEAETRLAAFFGAVQSRALDMECIVPGRFLRGSRKLETVYFPDSALLPEKAGHETGSPSIPVSSRFCLTSSASILGLYRKMQYVHLLVNQVRGDKSKRKLAREELWKSQTGDYYFKDGKEHSQFHSKAYRNLLEAEKISRDKTSFMPSVIVSDFNFDSEAEYLIKTQDLNAYITPLGGMVFELDDFIRLRNCVSTSREGFRFAFRDSIIADPEAPPIRLDHLQYTETEMVMNPPVIRFRRDIPGKEHTVSGARAFITKTFAGKKSELGVSWELIGLETTYKPFILRSVCSFYLQDSVFGSYVQDGEDRKTLPGSKVSCIGSSPFTLVENGKDTVRISFSGDCSLSMTTESPGGDGFSDVTIAFDIPVDPSKSQTGGSVSLLFLR